MAYETVAQRNPLMTIDLPSREAGEALGLRHLAQLTPGQTMKEVRALPGDHDCQRLRLYKIGKVWHAFEMPK